MNEQHLQDKFLVPFFVNALGYQEVKANTVTSSLIIEEDLEAFISQTSLNKTAYHDLLKKYHNDRKQLLADVIALLQERIASSRNMALFINANKSFTLQGIKLHLFYPSDSVIHGNTLFEQNIFSVVQELSYSMVYQNKKIFTFRPDLCFFINGIYLGYSELKSNYTGQNASKNGRGKVVKDYLEAVSTYHKHIDSNAQLTDKDKEDLRKEFLKVFEKAIHISTTDIHQTYLIRHISDYFDEMLANCRSGKFDRQHLEDRIKHTFKPYPLLPNTVETTDKLKEIFTAHYGKTFIEKEILYYNFIERDVHKVQDKKEVKDEKGYLIAPRPKQKFGTDKIMAKIDEFLAHEGEDDYFIGLLQKQLANVSETKRQELIAKRKAYANNKNTYSLLMQYAAGFGKSNIIGWSALQLKDLRRNGDYVYDKIMIVVDRVQLRDQIDSKMLNMNIDNKMYMEVRNKTNLQEALKSDTRIVIVNLQKFGAIKELLDADVLAKLASLRIVFLIDEIHRSNSGDQHDNMVNIFDELQTAFDVDSNYNKKRSKKNLIIGFTATPDDHTLARFGEYSGYAEGEKLWIPFDSYTMKEAIDDGFILNPLKNIIPIASKMIFAVPDNATEGVSDTRREYKDVQKKQIYEERERISAISKYVADLLVKDVYHKIRGTAKAMLAVYSIKAAIAYKDEVTTHFAKAVEDPKYQRYANAPIYIVYSSSQDEQNASQLNDGLNEQQVLNAFAQCKNGLIIVVAKLQTGFDEKKLHTLFLDKEVRGISAIQTISRVNRTAKYKNDCKIIDFSYENVNVKNIKEAFEHFSDVVVSDFDPHSDARILELLYIELKKSDVYQTFYKPFLTIFKDDQKRDNPESYLDFENSLRKHIDTHPKHSADTKAKSSQYFSILNNIEYVIALDPKFSEGSFLFFWRKFNTLYNTMHRIEDTRDPIDVYFDNQIGIIEKQTQEAEEKGKKKRTMATAGSTTGGAPHPFNVMDIIEARNQNEEQIATLIQEFESKILAFFAYIPTTKIGERLIVKIKSSVAENEIYDTFAIIYRSYKILKQSEVGEYFFKETSDLVNKLCDDFEKTVRESANT